MQSNLYDLKKWHDIKRLKYWRIYIHFCAWDLFESPELPTQLQSQSVHARLTWDSKLNVRASYQQAARLCTPWVGQWSIMEPQAHSPRICGQIRILSHFNLQGFGLCRDAGLPRESICSHGGYANSTQRGSSQNSNPMSCCEAAMILVSWHHFLNPGRGALPKCSSSYLFLKLLRHIIHNYFYSR